MAIGYIFNDDSRNSHAENDLLMQFLSLFFEPEEEVDQTKKKQEKQAKEESLSFSPDSKRYTIFDLYQQLEPNQVAIGMKTGIKVTIDEKRNLLDAEDQTFLPMSSEILEDMYHILEEKSHKKEERVLVPNHIAFHAYTEGYQIEVDYQDRTYRFIPHSSNNPLVSVETFYKGKWYIIEEP